MTDGQTGPARKGAAGNDRSRTGTSGNGSSGKGVAGTGVAGTGAADTGADASRAEQVLSQALRVMAGGGKQPALPTTDSRVTRRRLTTGQLILLAAILGLLVGIAAGFVSLML